MADPRAPDDAVLRRFLLGDVSAAEASRVELYLESDAGAASRLDALTPADDLTAALQDGPTPADTDPEVEALVAALERLPTAAADGDAASGATLVAPPSHAPAPVPDDADDDWTDEAATAFLAPPAGPGEIGRLGGYRVLGVLGQGGMGIVFEAEDPRLGRRVALKVMRPHVARRAKNRERFLREAKAAAAVEHDHVIPIYQVGEDRGVPFIAMPLLKGESLDARLKRDRVLPPAEVARVGREAAEGLAAAHEMGLIHRDIKPANLWLEGSKGRVKILDFGLARAGGESAHLTQTGAIIGTPAYMSPEQARGLALDARSDLFSLGAVLYRAATGRSPFAGTDALSTLAALASDTPPDPRTLNPDFPAPLAAAILRLLEKDPAKRPATAREAAESLAFTPAPAPTTPTPIRRPSPDADPTEIIPPAPAPGPAPRKKSPAPWVAVAAALVVLVGGGGWALYEFAFKTRPGTPIVPLDDPPPVVKADPPEPGGSDRLAAEKLRALKAGLVVRRAGAGPERVDIETPLPAGDFRVVEVNLQNKPTATEAGAAGLAPLPELTVGQFNGTAVGDAWVEYLAKSKKLSRLHLNGTKVTDAGLASLPGLDELALLDLCNTAVTDAGLKHVVKLPALGELALSDVAGVTDESLRLLAGVKTLRLVHLGRTGATAAGVKALAAALPGCRIESDHGAFGPEPSDRKAAEWVLSAGGTVTIESADGKRVSVPPGQPLPAGPFTVRGVTLPGESAGGNLHRLAGLRGLESLVDVGGTAADDDLKHLAGAAALKHLGLPNSAGRGKVTAAGLKHLTGLPALETLNLSGQRVGDAGLAEAAKMKGLAALTLGNTSGGTDAGLKSLAGGGPLRELEFGGPGFTDDGLRALAGIKTLSALTVVDTKATGAGLAGPGAFPKLTLLTLRGPAATDDALRAAATLPALTGLYLFGARVTDAGLAALVDAPKLRELGLTACPGVTDTGVAALAGAKALTSVTLYETGATSAGVRKLRAARKDCTVTADEATLGRGDPDRAAAAWVWSVGGSVTATLPDGTGVTVGPKDARPDVPFVVRAVLLHGRPGAAGQLHKLGGLTKLESLNLLDVPVADADLDAMAALVSLQTLDLSASKPGMGKLTAAGLAKLKPLTELTDLWLHNQAVGDAGAAHAAAFPRLSRLSLGGTGLTDAGLGPIGKFAGLKELLVSQTAVTDAGLKHLAPLKNLQILHAGNTGVTGTGLAALRDRPAFRALLLSGPAVTDAGVKEAVRLPLLTELSVVQSGVTDDAVAAVAAAGGVVVLDLSGNKNLTDAGLKSLAKCRSLAILRLADCPGVTDAGLAELAGIKTLTEVHLHGTKVTPDGVKKLATALPRCTVRSGPGAGPDKNDPDRAAAEWVRSVGGAVEVRLPGGARSGIDPKAPLPAGSFTVTTVLLSARPGAVGNLGRLAGLRGVTRIILAEVPVTDADLDALASLPGVEDLELSAAPGKGTVTAAGLAGLKPLAGLRYLRLDGQPLGDAGLARLGDFPQLTKLSLAGAPGLTDAGLEPLGKLAGLTDLDLLGTDVGDDGMRHLAGLKGLTALHLHGTKATGRGLAGPGRFSALTHLTLSGPGVTDAGVKDAAGLPALTRLNLSDTGVTDAGVAAVAAAGRVTELGLNGSAKLTDAGLKPLGKCAGLRVLSLSRCPGVTDAGLAELAGLKGLADLYLSGTKASPDGVKKFAAALPGCTISSDHGAFGPNAAPADPDRAAAVWVQKVGGFLTVAPPGGPPKSLGATDPLPAGPFAVQAVAVAGDQVPGNLHRLAGANRLTALTLMSVPVTDADLEAVGALTTLRKLDLASAPGPGKLTAAGLARLKALVELAHLRLDSQPVGDAGLARLTGFPKLVALSLQNVTGVTDAGLEHVGNITSLADLDLSGTGVTDDGMKHLAGLKKLEVLTLQNTKVTGRGLAALKDLPALAAVTFAGPGATDDGLKEAAKLPAVRSLALYRTGVTDAGLAAVADAGRVITLDLNGCGKVTDAGVKALAKSGSLRFLYLMNCDGVTDGGLADLVGHLPRP